MSWYDLETILARTDLSDLAGRLGLNVVRKGENATSQCPFHDDTKPSLVFYKGNANSPPHFHCFACNAHGHAVDLVKQVQGGDFKSAVAWLASVAGVPAVKRQGNRANHSYVDSTEALAFAQKVFDLAHDKQEFKAWCDERGFESTMLYEAGLRCLRPASILIEALKSEPPGAQYGLIDQLCAKGLITRLRAIPKDVVQGSLNLQEQFRDYFHDGRVIIPISSMAGTTEAYAGRLRGKEYSTEGRQPAKYLLSPGFQKSLFLFNGDRAKKLFFASSDPVHDLATLYLVEGFFDALRLHSCGLPAMATMGTSLSSEQRSCLVQLAKDIKLPAGQHLRVRIFFDRDAAGFAGVCRLARQLIGLEGVEVEWVGFAPDEPLPGKDPDELLRPLTRQEATRLLDAHARPIISALIAENLGYKDVTPLQDGKWDQLSAYPRERALHQAIRTLHLVSLSSTNYSARLLSKDWEHAAWHIALQKLLESDRPVGDREHVVKLGFLIEEEARLNHARMLAEYGSRRGELPCDDETWRALDRSAPLFNELLRARLSQPQWVQAAPADAVHLPRKLSGADNVLRDPRRKVMPHPADLHFQQFLMNELLTERHDFIHSGPKNFSDCIPAVRWFSTEREVRVTGVGDNPSPALQNGEEGEPTLSFGYQIDMDVLEGRRKPSDQGMFRPYMDCWRSFMDSLRRQSAQIGPRLHVLRLDAKRYYDSIERFVLRDRLVTALEKAISITGRDTFKHIFNNEDRQIGGDDNCTQAEFLVNRLCDSLFAQQYLHPDTGEIKTADAVLGIPQGPVLSAWMGTIALFPVDGAARDFMRRANEVLEDGSSRCLVGYARYVDDIILMADTEVRMEAFRREIVEAAAKLRITLVRKGGTVIPGSPGEIMEQLNQGRILAASVPAFEPLMRGDGESGWGIEEDNPVSANRQNALQVLRHPALLDEYNRVEVHIRDVMRAPDLRPSDLGRCAQALWWQSAMATINQDSTDSGTWANVYRFFLNKWELVCAGHRWAGAFASRGYDTLAAIEGLDMLLDRSAAMEAGRVHTWISTHRAAITKLEDAILLADEFLLETPAENNAHIRRRIEKLKWKAWKLRKSVSLSKLEPHQAGPMTAENWFCLAAITLNRIKMVSNEVASNPLAEFKKLVPQAPAFPCALLICNYLVGTPVELNADSGNAKTAAQSMALQFLVANTPSEYQARVLAQYPELLGNGCKQQLMILPPLPLEKTRLWAYSEEPPLVYAFGDKEESLPPGNAFGSEVLEFVAAPCESLAFTWAPPAKLIEGFCRFESASASFTFTPPTPNNRARFAAELYRVLYAIYLQHKETNTELVPVWAHLARSLGSGAMAGESRVRWYLITEPVDPERLGAMAFVNDGSGGLRSIAVPHGEFTYLWRIGCAVSDAIGIVIDWPSDAAYAAELEDEEGTVVRQLAEIERYILRQQLAKLRGTWLSDAKVRGAQGDALPRTIERALAILHEFDTSAPEREQVLQVLCTEAETQGMVMRLKTHRVDDLRTLLHLLPEKVLNRIPVAVLAHLTLDRQDAKQFCRADLALSLGLARTLLKDLSKSKSGNKSAELLKALALSACLAAAASAIRGLLATTLGIVRLKPTNSLPDVLTIPDRWTTPEGGRFDIARDYAVAWKWAIDDNWSHLSEASPWQVMLLLIGALQGLHPQAFDLDKPNPFHLVYEHLRHWQSAAEATVDSQSWSWPFDGLPDFDFEKWQAFLGHLSEAVQLIDEQLGVVVEQVQAPTFSRNHIGKKFIDAGNQEWALSLVQFTGLGRSNSVARVQKRNTTRRLVTWSEVRRAMDGELLSVHTLDDKLGQWYALATVQSALETSHENEVAVGELGWSSNQVAPQYHTTSTMQAVETSNGASERQDGEQQEKGLDESNIAASAQESGKFAAQFKREQRMNWANRGAGKAGSHVRVALFQWRIDETYSHPIAEAGLHGLGLPEQAQNDLRGVFVKESAMKRLDQAAKRGREYLWKTSEGAPSWPEHRRRCLLTEALNACQQLGVELLILPEVAVRPATVAWLEDKLNSRFPGLAVLVGTYRDFGEALSKAPEEVAKPEQLLAPLTLLWNPKKGTLSELIEKHGARTSFWFQRGKKYRAVAAKEFFRPDWQVLQPLFRAEPMLNQLLNKLRFDQSITQEDLRALFFAIEKEMPAMRYCMELICSELFLLTSPANLLPLAREVDVMLRRFPGARSESGKEIVNEDIESLGRCLSIQQDHGATRRSVLLVPAATMRTNDYWHAGQASVLASGTATVFCNAARPGIGAGGSCFIGIDSASKSSSAYLGIIDQLTPYQGWSKGILNSKAENALSEIDQAVVVVDLDPVHVVVGKPRPQLLAEPMSLVAYLPVVELLDAAKNADGLLTAMKDHLQQDEFSQERAKQALMKISQRPKAADPKKFWEQLETLPTTKGSCDLEEFIKFFSDTKAIEERYLACYRDREQQPANHAGEMFKQPAYLDILPVDLTLPHKQALPNITVPSWWLGPDGDGGNDIEGETMN